MGQREAHTGIHMPYLAMLAPYRALRTALVLP